MKAPFWMYIYVVTYPIKGLIHVEIYKTFMAEKEKKKQRLFLYSNILTQSLHTENSGTNHCKGAHFSMT